MDIEEIKKVAQEEMKKAITENLDSSIIFKYISNLEKELEKKEAIINELSKAINKEYYKDVLEKFIKKVEDKQYEC